MRVLKKIIVGVSIVVMVGALSACAGKEGGAEYPLPKKDARKERIGSLTGEGGLVLGKSKGDAEGAIGSGIGINSYLWRASLDTVSFMPLASADPFGGVIITDWYQNPEVTGERFKLNILIMDSKLKTTALKVTTFKQLYDAKKGWYDATVNPNVARELENKILTRARELQAPTP